MSDDQGTSGEHPEIEYGKGLTGAKVSDTLYERFDQSPMAWAPAADGLPSPVGISIEGAVPLSTGTLVCLEDRSSFVLRARFSGAVLARFEPSEVAQLPNGGYRTALSLALPRLAASRSVEALALLASLGRDALLSGGHVGVEPVRPRCRHFGRQMVDFPEEQKHQIVERMCMRRSTSDGIPVSLMDSAMYACDLRSPRDLESERRVDAADDRIIAKGEERRAAGTFNVDAALDADAAALGVPLQGIFGKQL